VVEIARMLIFAVLTAYVDSNSVVIIRKEAGKSPCYEREGGGLPIKYECIVRGIWTHEIRVSVAQFASYSPGRYFESVPDCV
jgi:hypothetical protein